LISIHPQCHTVGFCFLVQPENSTSTALLPGPDYGTAVCQQQVQVLTQTLATVSVCSEWKSKILCECHSQEECLGRVLNAATKFASESCASERKACGEKIDFEPELSQSFSPDFGPFANFAGETSGRISPSLAEQKQCQLYHLCKKTPEPHIDVAGKQEMERLPSANPPEKASSAPLEGAVPPDYPKFPAGHEEMERLPSAKLPQKTPSALSEEVVLPEPWSRDINSFNPTLTQRSPLDGLSRKGPGLSVQTSEALSGVSDTGRKREVGTMSDSFKEKLPLNMGEQSGFPELPPEVKSVAENPTFWASHPLENPDATPESSKLQQSIFSPSARPSPTKISLFPMDDLATSS